MGSRKCRCKKAGNLKGEIIAMKKTLTIVSVFLLILLSSCNLDVTEISRQKELESISVDSSQAVIAYEIGATDLNTEKLKVYAHYTDNSKEEINVNLAVFDGFITDKQNDKLPITVTYMGKSAVYYISVGFPQVTDIRIKRYPKQMYYYGNNTNVSTEGLIVEAVYNTGKIEALNEDQYSIRIDSLEQLFIVYITYENENKIPLTTNYTVFEKEINNVQANNTVIYKLGSKLNPKDFNVTVNSESTTIENFYYDPMDLNGLEEGARRQFTININNNIKIVEVIIRDYQVEDFLVQYKKGRTEFYCGETLKLSDFSFQEKLVDDCGIKIIANDKVKITKISEDSSVEIIGNNESPEEFKIIKPGIISVTFRYEVENQEPSFFEKTLNLYAVNPYVDSISTVWNDDKKNLPLGEQLSDEFITVTGATPGNIIDIPVSVNNCKFTYCDVTNYSKFYDTCLTNNSTEIVKTETKYLNGKSCNFYTHLKAPDSLRVYIINPPNLNYTEAEDFTFGDNFKADVYFNDGHFETITQETIKAYPSVVTWKFNSESSQRSVLQLDDTKVTLCFFGVETIELQLNVEEKETTIVDFKVEYTGEQLYMGSEITLKSFKFYVIQKNGVEVPLNEVNYSSYGIAQQEVDSGIITVLENEDAYTLNRAGKLNLNFYLKLAEGSQKNTVFDAICPLEVLEREE